MREDLRPLGVLGKLFCGQWEVEEEVDPKPLGDIDKIGAGGLSIRRRVRAFLRLSIVALTSPASVNRETSSKSVANRGHSHTKGHSQPSLIQNLAATARKECEKTAKCRQVSHVRDRSNHQMQIVIPEAQTQLSGISARPPALGSQY